MWQVSCNIFVFCWIVGVTETSLLAAWEFLLPFLLYSRLSFITCGIVARRKSAGNLSPLSCFIVMKQVNGMSSKKPCLGGVILILDTNIQVKMNSFSEETYWRSGVNKGKSKTSVHTAVLGAGWKGLWPWSRFTPGSISAPESHWVHVGGKD